MTVKTKEQSSSSQTLTKAMNKCARQGDQDSFEYVYKTMRPRLTALFKRMGTRSSEIEDLVQETMTRVWDKAETFDPERGNAGAWISRIGRNVCLNDWQRAGKSPTILAN